MSRLPVVISFILVAVTVSAQQPEPIAVTVDGGQSVQLLVPTDNPNRFSFSAQTVKPVPFQPIPTREQRWQSFLTDLADPTVDYVVCPPGTWGVGNNLIIKRSNVTVDFSFCLLRAVLS